MDRFLPVFLCVAGLLGACHDKTLIASLSTDDLHPVVRVDLNMAGRQTEEVNAPDFTSWAIADSETVEQSFDNITISFEKAGDNGTGLRSEWYKAGIQPPVLARLVNDGMTVADGEAGASILMTIDGLPAGTHTLLTYHNTFINSETYTHAPLNIYVNDLLTVDGLVPTNRAETDYQSQSAYLILEAQDGEPVTVLFEADTTAAADWQNVAICGFELNTPDVERQAAEPTPINWDTHVDADDGSATLTWTAAQGAVSHEIYFGTDRDAVEAADTNAAEYHGSVTDAVYTAGDLYSAELYFWRVDEVYSDGERVPGDVWAFQPRQLAFPDAEGGGRFARGGRGGTVVYVSSLNDDGPGSLREAVTSEIGPRTVLFTVSGVIALESELALSDDFVTVAGQTAPGKGICIRKASFVLNGGKDVILSHLRLRLGSGATYGGMGLGGADHAIMDHCSISWTVDEAFTSGGARNITLQRTMISEPLDIAGHDKYPEGTAHGFAANIGGDIGTFHHNLIAHSQSHNWALDGRLDGENNYIGRLDIYNNVVYNWLGGTTEGGAHQVNFMSNFYKTGPATGESLAINVAYEDVGEGTQQYYFDGNVMPGYFDESNQEDGRGYTGEPNGYEAWVDTPFDFMDAPSMTEATAAYKNVLSDVGQTLPAIDDHDVRIIQETLDGTATYTGSIGGHSGIIDSEDDAGGYEDYPEETRASDWDSDLDGLPDFWETLNGTNPRSASGDFSDANADPDMDGFTALDDYLSWISVPHFFIEEGTSLTIDLPSLFRGYTDEPSYSIASRSDGAVTIQDNSEAIFTPEGYGLSEITFSVVDGEGDGMTRTVHVFTDIAR